MSLIHERHFFLNSEQFECFNQIYTPFQNKIKFNANFKAIKKKTKHKHNYDTLVPSTVKLP